MAMGTVWASGTWAVGAWADGTWAGATAPAVVVSTPSGGFWNGYDIALARKRRLEDELAEAERAVLSIPDQTDREIAVFLKQQERNDLERAERERLRQLAIQFNNEQASKYLGERLANAIARAAVQGNFSSIEAMMREAKRAKEEEDFIIQAALLAIELT